MVNITDEDFEKLIAKALDELPKEQTANLNNVAITFGSSPTLEQAKKLKLRGDSLLLGLYEGIPLTRRTGNYSLVLPDKITIFKDQILKLAKSEDQLFAIVKHTLWHEIAHFYGLDHEQIHKIEGHWKSQSL